MPGDRPNGHHKLDDHPWWSHTPSETRARLRSKARWRNLKLRLTQRWTLVAITAGLYLLMALLPVLVGARALSLMTVVPILLLPALFGLIWWLAWKEYHD